MIQKEATGEGNGSSQSTIGDDELILGGQFDYAELVDYVRQTNHTWKREGTR